MKENNEYLKQLNSMSQRDYEKLALGTWIREPRTQNVPELKNNHKVNTDWKDVVKKRQKK